MREAARAFWAAFREVSRDVSDVAQIAHLGMLALMKHECVLREIDVVNLSAKLEMTPDEAAAAIKELEERALISVHNNGIYNTWRTMPDHLCDFLVSESSMAQG